MTIRQVEGFVADTLKDSLDSIFGHDRHSVVVIAMGFARQFRDKHPNFDEHQFLVDCGVREPDAMAEEMPFK